MRREFDIRVGNINKISSKIDDLLQYVKHIKKDDKPTLFNRTEDDSLEIMRARELKKIKDNFDQKEGGKESPYHAKGNVRQTETQQRSYKYRELPETPTEPN